MAIKMRRLCDLWTAISHTSPSIKWHLVVAQYPQIGDYYSCWSTNWETKLKRQREKSEFLFLFIGDSVCDDDNWRLWSRLIPFDWITQIATHSLPNWIEKWFCRCRKKSWSIYTFFCMKIISSNSRKAPYTYLSEGNTAMLIAQRLNSECD